MGKHQKFLQRGATFLTYVCKSSQCFPWWKLDRAGGERGRGNTDTRQDTIAVSDAGVSY